MFDIRTKTLVTVLVTLAGVFAEGSGIAQLDLAPAEGGTTYSLGMPPVYKGRSGFELQWYRPQNNGQIAAAFNLGLAKDLVSPVVGIAGLRAEGYVGPRDEQIDGGGRFLFEMPSFHFGVGVDYNVTDDSWDTLLQFDLPIKRGGIFGRGDARCAVPRAIWRRSGDRGRTLREVLALKPGYRTRPAVSGPDRRPVHVVGRFGYDR